MKKIKINKNQTEEIYTTSQLITIEQLINVKTDIINSIKSEIAPINQYSHYHRQFENFFFCNLSNRIWSNFFFTLILV